MALSAAKSDLTLSMTGEDETAQMLMDAKDRVEALEGKLKSLKQAGDAQAAQARQQSSALGAVNSRMVTVSKSAEGVIEGFDKSAAAIGKVTGVLGFWGAAITGAVSLAVELYDAISNTTSAVNQQKEAFDGAINSAAAYTAMLANVSKAAVDAAAKAAVATQGALAIDVELAKRAALGEEAVAKAEFTARQAAMKERAKLAEDERKQVEDQLKAAQVTYQGGLNALSILDTKIAARDAEIQRRLRGGLADTVGIREAEKLLLVNARNDLADEQLKAEESIKRLRNQLTEMGVLADKVAELQATPEVITMDPLTVDPTKPRGGGSGPAKETDREKRDRELRQEKERRQQEIRMNREFTAQVLENARIRDERLEAEAKAQKEAAEARKKLAQEQALSERMSDAKPVLDFASALTSNLVPALGEVQGLMDEVTNIFDKFTEGQTSMTQALGQGAMEIAAFAAKSIGGVKAEAAVRAIYEAAMGFATLSTPALSIGHFTAAAMLTGVATGVIGGSAAPSAGAAPKGIGKPSTSHSGSAGGGNNNGGPVTNVYNLTAGVIDGQSTTRAFRRAELQSRGSGFATAGGW
jgi:hypothetical protein